MRGDPEEAYTRLADNLQTQVGDRYRLFLVEGQDSKPVVIVLPSSRDPKPMTLTQKIVAVLLLGARSQPALKAVV